MVMLPILIGPASAPILGGALTEWLSWRWVFLINVPVGVAMVPFALRFLPATHGTPGQRLDVIGMAMSGVGLSSLLYAVSEGAALGWGSAPVLISGCAGLMLLTTFARRSLHHPDPILRIRLLRDRLFRATNIVFALSTGPFLGSLYLTPIFLQEILHQSALSSGATTFVEAVGVGIGSQTLVRLYPRLGPRTLATIGSLGIAVYLSLFMLVVPGTSLWLIRGLMLLGGIFNACAFLAVQTSMFTTISSHDLGHASAIYNTARQSTIALNVAVVTTVAAGAATGDIAAFHSAYLVAAGLAVIGAVCALTLIHTSDAHATMNVGAATEAP